MITLKHKAKDCKQVPNGWIGQVPYLCPFKIITRRHKFIYCYRLVADFVDKVLRENASRASAREPPLSYREAKERWNDVLEKRAGYGARAAALPRDGLTRGSAAGGGNKRQRAGNVQKGKDAKTANGEAVCYHFNRKSGCNRPKKLAVKTAEARVQF